MEKFNSPRDVITHIEKELNELVMKGDLLRATIRTDAIELIHPLGAYEIKATIYINRSYPAAWQE
jgi:hypothetical protein